jgi:hypothetical protein
MDFWPNISGNEQIANWQFMEHWRNIRGTLMGRYFLCGCGVAVIACLGNGQVSMSWPLPHAPWWSALAAAEFRDIGQQADLGISQHACRETSLPRSVPRRVSHPRSPMDAQPSGSSGIVTSLCMTTKVGRNIHGDIMKRFYNTSFI